MGGECLQCRYKGQRGDSSYKQDGVKFNHATHNSIQFKTYKLFISLIFHLIVLDRSWPWVTEITGSKMADIGGLLYYLNIHAKNSLENKTRV